MNELHPFDQAIALQPLAPGRWSGRTSAAYGNMIGPYGGLTAAQLLQAVLLSPDLLGEPVALTVNFAAAVADGSFEVVARPARTNRSTQHWMVEMRQAGEVVGTATVVTGVHRTTWGVQEAMMPPAPQPAEVARSRRRGVEWLNRYEMRPLVGDLPRPLDGRAGPDSLSRLWVRDDPPRPLDFASLTALADVFFPRIWLRRARLVPLGTVSMTVYFHATTGELQATGAGHLLIQAQGHAFGGGFFDHSGHLWNAAGTLLATTHQVMYYKE